MISDIIREDAASVILELSPRAMTYRQVTSSYDTTTGEKTSTNTDTVINPVLTSVKDQGADDGRTMVLFVTQ